VLCSGFLTFLQCSHGLVLLQIGLPIAVIYVLTDGGSVAGGWLSSFLVHRGKTVTASRKIAMLICALNVLLIVFVPQEASTWGAVFLLGIATNGAPGIFLMAGFAYLIALGAIQLPAFRLETAMPQAADNM
jgi:hypothetical protein